MSDQFFRMSSTGLCFKVCEVDVRPEEKKDADCPPLELSEILDNWKVEGTECNFVRCKLDKPHYRLMSEKEKSYYFYWRTMVRKGKFVKSSPGYLYLFTDEIINNNKKSAENLKNLMNVIGVYRSLDPALTARMCDAAYVYAKINHLPEPDIQDTASDAVAFAMVTKSLLDDPIGKIGFNFLKRLPMTVERRFIDPSVPYGYLLTEALRRIEDYEIKEKGKRLIETVSVRGKRVDAYPDFDYFGGHGSVTAKAYAFPPGSEFTKLVRYTLGCIIKKVRINEWLPQIPDPPVTYKYRFITDKVVSEWKGGRWDPDTIDYPDFVLNQNSVSSAKEDLEAVTELMGTECDEPEETITAETEKEIPSDGDPWSVLSSALDGESLKYLKGAMKGDAKKVLKELGVRMAAVEERINALAMETVQDVIIEDGNVIEEYRDELERML